MAFYELRQYKVLPDQMIQWDVTRRQVAPVLVGRKLDLMVASERLQRLDFDQCRLTIDVVFLRVCAGAAWRNGRLQCRCRRPVAPRTAYGCWR